MVDLGQMACLLISNDNLTNLFAEGRIQVQVQLTVKLNNKQTMLMTATNKINNIYHLLSTETEFFINYQKNPLIIK